ncbi:MAG: RNA pseudouridine synthase, partial [Bacteroidales bacterium]|nr:RNA pseudouridine synthase [Bacteroidales bacterium]
MIEQSAVSDNDILYEDNHLIIINKKPGEIVQGDKTGDLPLSEKLKDHLKKKYNKPGNVFIGVIHRIDRPVSGAVAFAKTSKGLARMNQLVKERDVRKIYWALIEDQPENNSGTLVHYLKKDQKKNKSFAVDEKTKGALYAELEYRFVAASNNYSLLEVELMTGRHHQIRAQLAAIGAPIKGDVKYGFKRLNKDGRMIHLHARSLEFVHPVKKDNIKGISRPPWEKLWHM